MASSQSGCSCSKTTAKGASHSSQGDVSRGVGITPICYCGDFAVLKVAKTARNAGRKFWAYRHYKGAFTSGMSCNFFKWFGEENGDDRDGSNVRQSNKRTTDMESAVKELQRMMKFVVGVGVVVIVGHLLVLVAEEVAHLLVLLAL
ncbi:uncharacterized protein LOC106753744 [Vigna radiata var. radiata]|uniref:Uncharacterized protein LOC106753744 n=1 Tax=Vigna radiata var. radiata TaxID=3916 RepID=A0A1S3TBD7_VIGRR|nr:uncharacterized protein LOC106753744 [Vigna radiata var. radiata]